MPSIDQPLPPFRQIARYIAEQIAKGVLKPGDKIPSGTEIMDEWKVSKATANKALGHLKAEGLVETHVGHGTLVSGPTAGIGPNDMFGRIKSAGKIYLPNERSEKVTGQALGVDAPAHVVAALGATEQSALIYRRRVIFRDDAPYSVAVSWFLPALLGQQDPSLADRLLDVSSIPEGTPKFVADRIGRTLDEGVDHVSAVDASPDAAEALGVAEGSPMMRIVSTLYAEDWPIEVGEYLYPAGAGVSYSYSL